MTLVVEVRETFDKVIKFDFRKSDHTLDKVIIFNFRQSEIRRSDPLSYKEGKKHVELLTWIKHVLEK